MTTFSVGDPDDAIFVVVDCNLACFRSRVEIPDDTEDKPTTIALTTAFVPIPDGLKSTLIFDPSRYAVYVPNPVALSPPGEVVNLPYSRIETSDPSWTIFSSWPKEVSHKKSFSMFSIGYRRMVVKSYSRATVILRRYRV